MYRLLAIALPAVCLAIACGDDSTTSSGPTPTPAVTPTPTSGVISAPVLQVTSPARGAFIEFGGDATVRGMVRRGSSPITELRVQGARVDIAGDGTFSHRFPPDPGVNLVRVTLTDEAGNSAIATRAFYYGPLAAEGIFVDDAVLLHLGPDALDDDDEEVDDLARITEIMIEENTVGDDGGFVVSGDSATLVISDVSVSDAAVDIAPRGGGLDLRLTVTDLSVVYAAESSGVLSPLSGPGTITADTAILDLVVSAGVASDPDGGRQLAVSIVESDSTIEGFDLVIEDLTEDLGDTLRNLINDTLERRVVDILVDEVAGSLETILADILDDLVIEQVLGEETPVLVEAEPSSVLILEGGLRAGLALRAESFSSFEPAAGAGFVKTGVTLPDRPLSSADMAAATHVDGLNAVLYSAWRGGFLRRIDLDAEAAANTGIELFLPPTALPQDGLSIEMDLPPSVRFAGGEFPLLFHLGEGRLTLRRADGERFESLVQLSARARVISTEGGELSVEIGDGDNGPRIDLQTIRFPSDATGEELDGVVEAVLPIISSLPLADLLSIAIPDIDLEAITGLEALSGIVLGLGVESLGALEPDRAHFIGEGTLVPRTPAE